MPAPLRLTTEQMRQIGHLAVDQIARHVTELGERPVGRTHTRCDLDKRFGTEIPEQPSPPLDVVRETLHALRETITHTDHPRFLAYVPGPSNYVGALADFVAAGLNVHAGAWVLGAGPAAIEATVVDWLRTLCGLPEGAGGLFVSGGTMASLVAIHAARSVQPAADRGTGAVYVSEQTHASIRRGLGFLGFTGRQIRTVRADGRQRLDVAALADRMRADRAYGYHPICVVATAGTTSTGAVDPLPAIAEVCRETGAWLHVDGAYGAAAVLTPAGRAALAGLDQADSIALDPHKWWFQPYEMGCVLVRDAATLRRAYGLSAEYLTETRLGGEPLNYYASGPQLTRGFRALKLWMSLRVFGLAAFRAAVAHGIGAAERAQRLLDQHPNWTVVTPAQLGIVTFRPRRTGLAPTAVDRLTRQLAARTLDDGYSMLITTEVSGRPVLRICTIHPELTIEQLTAIVDRLDARTEEILSSG